MFLAFGDSHRSSEALDIMANAIKALRPEFFVHTGDNYSDFKWLLKKTNIQGFGVLGNCDFNLATGAEEEIFQYKEKDFWLVHGHQQGVKYSVHSLVEQAATRKVDAVIFGHSHCSMAEKAQGVTFINPGSIPLPRKSEASFAQIEVVDGKITAEIISVNSFR